MTLKHCLNATDLPSEQLADWGTVAAPLGDRTSRLRGMVLAENEDGSEAGIWECTPGKWVRQVMDAELSTFLSGHALFTPENGTPIELKAGAVVYFPPNTKGVWEVLETTRKSYLIYKSR